MKNPGRIETSVYEVEKAPNDENRVWIIEYGNKISRVIEVNNGTGHVYRNLCCKIQWDTFDDADRGMIRKFMIEVRGIRRRSL